jgi:hypothetical protein
VVLTALQFQDEYVHNQDDCVTFSTRRCNDEKGFDAVGTNLGTKSATMSISTLIGVIVESRAYAASVRGTKSSTYPAASTKCQKANRERLAFFFAGSCAFAEVREGSCGLGRSAIRPVSTWVSLSPGGFSLRVAAALGVKSAHATASAPKPGNSASLALCMIITGSGVRHLKLQGLVHPGIASALAAAAVLFGAWLKCS